MVGIGRAVVQIDMAGAAVGRGVREKPVRMALGTLHGCMRTGQRKRCLRVIECGAGPIGGVMADRTISRESSLLMVRIRRAVVQRDMTGAAVGRCSGEDVIDMALSALNAGVSAR